MQFRVFNVPRAISTDHRKVLCRIIAGGYVTEQFGSLEKFARQRKKRFTRRRNFIDEFLQLSFREQPRKKKGGFGQRRSGNSSNSNRYRRFLGKENRVSRNIGKFIFIRLNERTHERYLQFRQSFADLHFLRDEVRRETQSRSLEVALERGFETNTPIKVQETPVRFVPKLSFDGNFVPGSIGRILEVASEKVANKNRGAHFANSSEYLSLPVWYSSREKFSGTPGAPREKEKTFSPRCSSADLPVSFFFFFFSPSSTRFLSDCRSHDARMMNRRPGIVPNIILDLCQVFSHMYSTGTRRFVYIVAVIYARRAVY